MRAKRSHTEKGPSLADLLRPPGPIELDIVEEIGPDQAVIRARGEVDILTAPRLSAALDEVLRGQSGDVVVDLRETAFLDSAGLFVLLNATRRLTRRGRKMRVVCGPGQARDAIEMARLGATLNLTDQE